MKLTIHCERGSYSSIETELTETQSADVENLIKDACTKGEYFKIETTSGYVVLGAELLKSAAFVVEA